MNSQLIPAAIAPAAASPAAASQLVSRTLHSGTRIMIIDDSKTIRRSAEILLMQAGCEVIVAEDGFDALEKIAKHRPDLVFVDAMMPRLDGYQTCQLLKRSSVYRHIPVILLTSKDGLYDRARAHAVGASQFLTKPFTKETLLQSIVTHLRKH